MPANTNSHTTTTDSTFVYTVSELNQDVRTLLERGFPQLWLEGEISNFACPSSGHWYFTLKDARAQVRCAMFKNKNRLAGFVPKQGDKVLIKARISLYEARGEYQILADSMEPAGSGALQRQFEALKKKLQKDGLFDPAVKKTLPQVPRQIGIITSPTGAAIRDIISVLKRRFPAIPVLVSAVTVQGNSAAREIADAIRTMDKSGLCDVIILARGGGSLEDLWSFNEELVANAVFRCDTPIISGIGHEIDFTIADFVADVRAPTPSAAAELVVPDARDIIASLEKFRHHISRLMTNKLAEEKRQFTRLSRRLKHPARQLSELSQQLDELELRLTTALKHRLNYKKSDFQQFKTRLIQHNPAGKVGEYQQKLDFLKKALYRNSRYTLENKSRQLQATANALHMVSPLATLDRGYAIVRLHNTADDTNTQKTRNNNCIVRSHKDVKPLDELEVITANGEIYCTVNNTSDNNHTQKKKKNINKT